MVGRWLLLREGDMVYVEAAHYDSDTTIDFLSAIIRLPWVQKIHCLMSRLSFAYHLLQEVDTILCCSAL